MSRQLPATLGSTRGSPRLRPRLDSAWVLGVSLIVAGVLTLLVAEGYASLTRSSPQWRPVAAPSAAAAAVACTNASADWRHPLFDRVGVDLRPFLFSGITLKHVEQAYCQGSRGSMRVQVINGSAYVAGESPLYESRGLSLKRQLLALWLAGDMPEGIDFVLEQEDLPTVRAPSADCPARGPLLAPAKQPANASHRHVLLAPDHSFAGWFEARTLPWDEMLPLLQRAARRHAWELRDGRLFFRGAATGERNVTDVKALAAQYPTSLVDVQLVNWTSKADARRFVSLADHCRYKLLLHLPGNSYAGRLKYLLACGSAVVVPENGWHEFWYHIIKPSTHLVVVEEVSMDNRGHHLAGVAAELQGDDWAARRLGAAGAELVAASLAPPMVQAYWRRLLSEYRRLQRYAASLHPDAVPLERAILVPELRNVTRRTCPVCAPTRDQLLEQLRADLGLLQGQPLPEVAVVHMMDWPPASAGAAALGEAAGQPLPPQLPELLQHAGDGGGQE